MTPSTSSTILGARPWLGSSNSTRPGAPSSARAIATICISPPDKRLGLARHQVLERREDVGHLGHRPGAEGGALLAERQVLGDRQRRAEAAVVRHPADAGAGDLVRGDAP